MGLIGPAPSFLGCHVQSGGELFGFLFGNRIRNRGLSFCNLSHDLWGERLPFLDSVMIPTVFTLGIQGSSLPHETEATMDLALLLRAVRIERLLC